MNLGLSVIGLKALSQPSSPARAPPASQRSPARASPKRTTSIRSPARAAAAPAKHAATLAAAPVAAPVAETVPKPAEPAPDPAPEPAPEAAPAEQPPPPPALDGTCTIRYNHYRDTFNFVNGRLDPRVVAARYYMAGAFHSVFGLHLLRLPGKDAVDTEPSGVEDPPPPPVDVSHTVAGVCSAARFFVGLEPGATYLVEVEQDADEYARSSERSKPLVAAELARLNPRPPGER